MRLSEEKKERGGIASKWLEAIVARYRCDSYASAAVEIGRGRVANRWGFFFFPLFLNLYLELLLIVEYAQQAHLA